LKHSVVFTDLPWPILE